MKLTDERLTKFLEKRLDGKVSIEKFLNPSENDLRPAKNLKNMELAVKKIRKAISENKRILIFGDYDADGVCASAILYLFLKSQGVEPAVFIPNRFEMGYGISVEAIDEIEFEYAPNLVITVDLGITAVEEVEILKQEGIETVITDHHLPLEELPDTIVVDPKVDPDGTYGFDGICGAGVALKLVEALSSRAEALKYVDIAAIATIGDIVPLIDENRAIAKLGLDKINSGNCVPSLTFLKDKLNISNLTSTDVSFKLVPRINACGRMSNAKKAFDFLVETDKKLLEIRYREMEEDNNLRLSAIDSGIRCVGKFMDTYDLDLPSILVEGEFHEGVLGILASRVCGDYKKPAIIFTKTLNQTYKGSGRSPANIDIFSIISKFSGLLENFGGHKMACGLEVSIYNFDEFKMRFNEELSKLETKTEENEVDEFLDAIEVTDDDFNLNFVHQINLLEPFGFANEKPKFSFKTDALRVEQVSDKSFKHYKFFTKKCNMLLAFSGKDEAGIAELPCEKRMLVDFGINEYKGRENLNVVLKKFVPTTLKFGDDFEEDFARSLFFKYNSIFDKENRENYHLVSAPEMLAKEKFNLSNYGTAVVVGNDDDLESLNKIGIDTAKYISLKPYIDAKNVILIGTGKLLKENLKGYKNIIFLHKYFDEEHLFFSEKFVVYENEACLKIKSPPKTDRETFAKVFKVLLNSTKICAEDELILAKKISKNSGFSYSQVMFCMLTFFELNFIEFDEILSHLNVLKSKKTELSASKIYGEIANGRN